MSQDRLNVAGVDAVSSINCPLMSASNVDQELGWTREEYKKIGVKYAFLRSQRGNNWYPHYNGLTLKDVQIVEFPYLPESWLTNPQERLAPAGKRYHKLGAGATG